MHLRIENPNGSLINEYRINNGRAEVRVLPPPPECLNQSMTEWRVLNNNDLGLHYALGTVVWQWFENRVGTDLAWSERLN